MLATVMNRLSLSAEIRTVVGLLALGLLLTAVPSQAAAPLKFDSLETCGHVYRNVTIVGYNVTDAYFMHQGGMTNVKLRYLDPKLQKFFQFDAKAAAAAEDQQVADDVFYNKLLASNIVAQAQQASLAAQRAASTSEDSLADPVSKQSLLGKPAPAIKGEKWLGEKPELEGKLILVAFWEPWSIPSRKYLPDLDALQKKFGGKMAIVGVTSDTAAGAADMDAPKVGFASVLDSKAKLASSVGVSSVPYLMVVDSKGVVRYQGHPTAITEKQVQHLLAKASE